MNDMSHFQYILQYEQPDFGDFGDDIYTTIEAASEMPKDPLPNIVTTDKTEEERKIKALVDTPAIDWSSQKLDSYGSRRGSQHTMVKRMTTGVNSGRVGLERKTPPSGYVCHRCNVPGHFIQHCPTNGDPAYDIKRLKPPTGIPQSMLVSNSDGSYALPGGAVAVLKPNEAAFEKEIEGLPTTCFAADLPVELHCPLCKRVMTDAVLTTKCCFGSFCDKCIREYILLRSMCICGATNILADDLVPNKTLRDTIINMVVSKSSSKSTTTENSQSQLQIQDVESACCVKHKAPPSTLAAASESELKQNSVEDSPSTKEGNKIAPDSNCARKSREKAAETIDLLESTSQLMSGTKSKSQQSAATSGVVKEKVLNNEQGKKKKKKTNSTESDFAAVNMQWSGFPDIDAGNWVNFPVHQASYNPYWASGGFPGGFDAYMTPYMASVPYTGYSSAPLDVLVGNILPQGSYGMQGYSSVGQRESFRNGEINANVTRLKHGLPPPGATPADRPRQPERSAPNSTNMRTSGRRSSPRRDLEEPTRSGSERYLQKKRGREPSEESKQPNRFEEYERTPKYTSDGRRHSKAMHDDPHFKRRRRQGGEAVGIATKA
uniref:Zinc knuckle CX2CX3GHX4C domain-containing protein n=1 Tax=Ananas comosus var. bracteatus TaxID=296719 RepID=A0A6V7QES8_ANACO|nr:unnamed protein product [Ananas comosus var. bracteatus]